MTDLDSLFAGQRPRAMVFDIGNVLLEWDPMRVYRDLVPDAGARAALFARVDFDGMNLAGDRNGDLSAEVEARAARHPDDAALIRAWMERWGEMIGPEIPAGVALLEAAQAAELPIVALSNFAADTYEIARARFPVLSGFDIEVISGRERCVKPDPAIYALVEERTRLFGADLFFLDDRPDNIAAAQRRGWRGQVFRQP